MSCPIWRAASTLRCSSTTTAAPGWSTTAPPAAKAALPRAVGAIWVQEFDRGTRKTFGPRTLLVDSGGIDISKKPVWIEGPHIFKKDGWYYLSCAEGGTAEGHSSGDPALTLGHRPLCGAWSGQSDPHPARLAARPPAPDHFRRPCPARHHARRANGGRPSLPCGPMRAISTPPGARLSCCRWSGRTAGR